MNIIEAAKTGLPMRRPGWGWAVWDHNKLVGESDGLRTLITQSDILADDWEVDEPKVTITRRDLERAWLALWNSDVTPQLRWTALAKELGL